MKRNVFAYSLVAVAVLACVTACAKDARLSKKELLGKKLFYDTNLSLPAGQSCAACHDRPGGWAGPDQEVNRTTVVYPGAQAPRFGNRRAPSASYTGFNPKLSLVKDGKFAGGLFWDGRATGWELGDPLAEQAMGPFLNPLEQNLPDRKEVVRRVMASGYAALFREVWGNDSLRLEDADAAYVRIAQSIASYERSRELNPFNSKFDDFWRKAVRAGLRVETISAKSLATFAGLGLSEQELSGLVLFNTKGKCANCHVLTPMGDLPPLFTDFSYDNLGIPKNPRNPFYTQATQWNPDGMKWVDTGLGGFLETLPQYKKYARANMGKHKVPTLRNVDLRESPGFVKSFMHNGFFTSLRDIVDFYNTRDVPGKNWPAPEVRENVNRVEMGDLGMSGDEVDAIVAFMKTLSDR